MAEATVELRHLLSTDFELFDFDYEFDDLTYKQELERAVTDYYFFYEIGQETPERFKHSFRSRWQRIIPYYNDLYNTTLLNYDPLVSQRLIEDMKQTTNKAGNTQTTGTTSTEADGTTSASLIGSSDQNTTTTSDVTTASSGQSDDYPADATLEGAFLSGATNSNTVTGNSGEQQSTGSTTSSSSGETHDTGSTTASSDTTMSDLTNNDYTRTVEALTGTTYQELIRQERANILRITEQVIAEMKPCFYLIY